MFAGVEHLVSLRAMPGLVLLRNRHEERRGRFQHIDWEGDVPLERPSSHVAIYEMHVRFCRNHRETNLDLLRIGQIVRVRAARREHLKRDSNRWDEIHEAPKDPHQSAGERLIVKQRNCEERGSRGIRGVQNPIAEGKRCR